MGHDQGSRMQRSAQPAPQRAQGLFLGGGIALGGQPRAVPLTVVQAVVKTVVQTVTSALPELDAVRLQAVTAPVLGTWRLATGEPLGDLAQAAFQLAAMAQWLALR